VAHTHTYTPIHFNREYLERVEHIRPSQSFWFAPLVCKQKRQTNRTKKLAHDEYDVYTHTHL